MKPLRPAVFFDRDGVLNQVVERAGRPASPRTSDELVLVEDLESVNRLSAAGYLVFIATNQPDIGRGLVTAEFNEWIVAEIRARVHIDDARICAHDDAAGCECRKPKPGMLLDLARHWRIDLARSWMIGDMWRDMEAARGAGCRFVLIRRPYNRETASALEADTLAGAIGRVMEQGEGER